MPSRTLRPPRASNDRGAALVEMAIILPLLIMLVFGLIEASRAYNTKQTLTHATREGVRVLAVTQDQSKAVAATYNSAGLLDPSLLSVSAGGCEPGEPTEVSASYPHQYSIPLIGSGTWTLSSTAVMRCGG